MAAKLNLALTMKLRQDNELAHLLVSPGVKVTTMLAEMKKSEKARGSFPLFLILTGFRAGCPLAHTANTS
ncbi:hypothetical protein FGF66_02565 [Chlorobaculum thiosulfatiphilum]|jgi:hypothetical protein|uniref:Uncharacterized protein n=1 Tax=Chlorobaculum thiosulfatiphilum TaxID=115852 RepID=A0A5C4S8G8_CHLTI|nr:hypothetical protein [Chlorobaculum thiosulfatiphilum]TNJ39833.1 hypothetical protein FGF66_02565 [Chlorobaculum thiosulfatiphilum]